jgi:hypothetical protein
MSGGHGTPKPAKDLDGQRTPRATNVAKGNLTRLATPTTIHS